MDGELTVFKDWYFEFLPELMVGHAKLVNL